MQNDNIFRYRARFIIPAYGQHIENGVLTIADGQVRSVDRYNGEPAEDLGDVAIVPGFVNAHTHLDLPKLDWPVQGFHHFADWLKNVIGQRLQIAPDELPDLIEDNIREVRQGGAVAVGDIATTAVSQEVLKASGLYGVAFREVLGLLETRFDPLWQAALSQLHHSVASTQERQKVTVGLSPHAPYSTSPIVYRRCESLPIGISLATHWFESFDEIKLLKNGSGRLFEFLRDLNAIPTEEGGARFTELSDPFEELLSTPGANRWILNHGNFLTPAHIDRMSEPAWRKRIAGVVYCPRTHSRFAYPPHPWRELLDRGMTVGLGTDSLSTNPDLSIHEEAKFLAARFPEVPAQTLLAMLTQHGADLLQLGDKFSGLFVGAKATATIIRSDFSKQSDPLRAIFSPDAAVAAIMLDGALHQIV